MDSPSEDLCHWLATQIVPHEPSLRDWLRRFAGIDQDEIDDLVQETYAVLAKRTDVSSIHNPRAYAFQVARSILLQQLRRARIVTIGALADLDHLDEACEQPSPEHHAIARDEYARVAQAIAEMPPQTRRAFQLRRVEGLSQREIAAQLDLSENTVEKHIMRGIKMLMKQFGRGGKVAPDASTVEQRGSSLHHDRPRARAKH